MCVYTDRRSVISPTSVLFNWNFQFWRRVAAQNIWCRMIEMFWCQECFQKLRSTAIAVPLKSTGSCGGHLENKRRSQLRKKLRVHFLTQQSHFGPRLDTAVLVITTVWLFRSLILACQVSTVQQALTDGVTLPYKPPLPRGFCWCVCPSNKPLTPKRSCVV